MSTIAPPSLTVLTVSQLNRLARQTLEQTLPVSWITGELSNFSRAASGHWYFTLKDSQASVRCAMFRTRNQFVDWQPRDGEHVEVRAQPTLYEARGEFQLIVDALRHGGQGDLFEAFLRLKSRLQAEGLFNPERKRPVPTMPACIGIITSPRAAALRDALTTLSMRWPIARVVLYPSAVQGSEAAAGLQRALNAACARRECDVLLLIRGGGSLEDLHAFNDETLARALATCDIPVISGIGHETDFTIADFVADMRAPTPTGAAQLVTPNATDLLEQLTALRARLGQAVTRRLREHAQNLDALTHRLHRPSQRLALTIAHVHALRDALSTRTRLRLQRAGERLRLQQYALRLCAPVPARNRQKVITLADRLRAALMHSLQQRAEQLATLRVALGHLDPNGVLQRGYAIVRDADGHVLRASETAQPGDRVDITLAHGHLRAEILTASS
jgi:exodeoxyribonuclease VII large subunit